MPGTPKQLATIILYSFRNGVPPSILYGVWGAESDFSRNLSTSSAGAMGPFQITKQSLAYQSLKTGDPNNFADAANAAAIELKADYNQFHDWSLAVAAYNAGAGAVHQYGGIPPFSETQAYVPKVNAIAKTFPAVVKAAHLPTNPADLANLPDNISPTGVEQAGNAIGDVLQAPITVAEFLGKLASHIFDGAWWLRVGKIGGGILLGFIALHMLAKGSTVGKAAKATTKVVPLPI